MAQTAACVSIFATNNVTLQDAFQFGTVSDTSWSFTGQTFKLEFKASRDDVSPLLTLTSGGGTIVIDDVVLRVLHLNVDEATLKAALPVGEYVYDLVMIDGSLVPVRVLLMYGRFCLTQGVTED